MFQLFNLSKIQKSFLGANLHNTIACLFKPTGLKHFRPSQKFTKKFNCPNAKIGLLQFRLTNEIVTQGPGWIS